MKKSFWSTSLPGKLGVLFFLVVAATFIWDGVTEPGFWGVCTGAGILLALGAFLYIQRLDDQGDSHTLRRIRAEFSPASQPEVLALYHQLKVKNLDGLFSKILDDARGNAAEVRKLAGIAESVGWNDFLEDKW